MNDLYLAIIDALNQKYGRSNRNSRLDVRSRIRNLFQLYELSHPSSGRLKELLKTPHCQKMNHIGDDMAKDEPYQSVVVETFRPTGTSGLHGDVHVRPVAGQGLLTTLHVECSTSILTRISNRDQLQNSVQSPDREGIRRKENLYSNFSWPCRFSVEASAIL